MSLAVGDWVTERNTKAAIAPNPWSPSYERVKQLIKALKAGQCVGPCSTVAAPAHHTQQSTGTDLQQQCAHVWCEPKTHPTL